MISPRPRSMLFIGPVAADVRRRIPWCNSPAPPPPYVGGSTSYAMSLHPGRCSLVPALLSIIVIGFQRAHRSWVGETLH
jgi:hypothetical protein